MREGNAERGFTLIELMIVVAIVAVLAMVVIPNFMQSSTKSKARTEAAAMFSELASKQEQFKAETSRYMGANTAPYNGTTTCPASVPSADYNFASSCQASTNAWTVLRIVAPQSAMRCQYTITAGIPGSTMTPPTGFKNSQGVLNTAETIATSWWQALATCDGSGTGGTNAQYYQTSVDRKIQALNEGT